MTSHDDLVRLWGEANVVRPNVDTQVISLPADAITVLRDVGLPRHADPLFEVRDLAMIRIPGRHGPYCRFGSDEGSDLCVSAETGEVGSFSPAGEYPARFVNTSLPLFVEFLVSVSAERSRFPGLDDDEIDHLVAALDERLQQLDEPAFADPDNWWSVIFEQLRDGQL
jgi:hypothetical protein